jgi:electron transfer flavoprotein beta subunit
MNIIVCVKTVPNPSLPVEFVVKKGTYIDEGWNYILNPADEVALEQALRLKEQFGGTVTVITADTKRGDETLKKCLSLGADTALRIDVPDLAVLDSQAIAKILSRAINRTPFNLVLCGDQSSDRNCGEVGSMLAELLGLPVITSVTQMDISTQDNSVTVLRKLEKGARERKRCHLPALLTADIALAEPRYPTLSGRKKAETSLIKILADNAAGPDVQKTRIISINRPPPKKIFIPGGNISPAERIRLLTQGSGAKISGAKSTGTNILEGNPEDIAKKVTAFLKERRLIPEKNISSS